jgi:hypothetical protein
VRFVRLAALAFAALAIPAACSTATSTPSHAPASSPSAPAATASGAAPSMSHDAMSAAPSAAAGSPAASGASVIDSKAADLRTTVDLLLGEHIFLATKATSAALGGRQAEFAAYGDLLNKNGTDIGDLIGAAYGPDAKDQFNKIWSAHNGFFVDYTTGVAKGDKAMQDKAVEDLTTQYVPQFAAFIATATGLPKDAVASLTLDHVTQTKQIVDDQAKKDWVAAYADTRKAFAHMQMIGDAIAPAIAAKFPAKFPGDSTSEAVGFRVALNGLLQEHLFLATDATGAALGGRADEFAAAGDALNKNGTDVGAALGSLYGNDAKDQFNKIWSAHNGFFVDYTTGVAKADKVMQDKAVMDLTQTYVPQFAAFIATATGLPVDAVTTLTAEHVTTTKDVVDAQGAKNAADAAAKDLLAAQHMQMIGDPLAKAIVAKLPAKF